MVGHSFGLRSSRDQSRSSIGYRTGYSLPFGLQTAQRPLPRPLTGPRIKCPDQEQHFWDVCPIPPGRLCTLLAVPLNHRSRRAPADAGPSASESMQDESALASLDLAGLESSRSICSSTALTELAADFRVRRPASVSSAWRTRWCCG